MKTFSLKRPKEGWPKGSESLSPTEKFFLLLRNFEIFVLTSSITKQNEKYTSILSRSWLKNYVSKMYVILQAKQSKSKGCLSHIFWTQKYYLLKQLHKTKVKMCILQLHMQGENMGNNMNTTKETTALRTASTNDSFIESVSAPTTIRPPKGTPNSIQTGSNHESSSFYNVKIDATVRCLNVEIRMLQNPDQINCYMQHL